MWLKLGGPDAQQSSKMPSIFSPSLSWGLLEFWSKNWQDVLVAFLQVSFFMGLYLLVALLLVRVF